MVQSEGVTNFVAGQQRQAVQHHLLIADVGIKIVERGEGIECRLERVPARWNRGIPIVIRCAHAMRVELYYRVENFTAAGIYMGLSNRPSAA